MKMKIAAAAVLALVVVALVPAVSAQPYEKAKGKYEQAKSEYQDIYSQWNDANKEFNQAMSQWRGNRNQQNFSQLMNAARGAATKAAELMVKNMEMVRARIEASIGISENQKERLYAEIDNYINEIRAKQLQIQNAGDQQQIRAAAGELHQYWLQIRVRLQQMTGEMMVNFAEGMVQRVRAIVATVETRVQSMKENGIDTSALENWLAEARSNISAAELKIAEAENIVNQINENTSFAEIYGAIQARIREAVSYLKESLKELKDTISEMKRHGYHVTIQGTGTLVAQGSGSIHLTGTGTVEVRAPIDGNMIVSPNATVTTSGNGVKTLLGNGFYQYQGYDNALITGTNITVDINGNGIDIVASGTGRVRITGTGTYQCYGENQTGEGNWNANGITVVLETGQAT
ncbi:MAG: hypothetical protein APZ16_00005 [Candidatus Hadarchaeum yellowstonense]|jgi:hypothetical protein|uniref:DUF5667 domain-containing protein n=1 Tax=Hadarchaeum yellowstonense TaxID=1776334 RepID=A0A147JVE2_HADYE|nr:MAG: hypothetical protein APZ16_00005 [Candidatus Hadarchaeum yellowstonense]